MYTQYTFVHMLLIANYISVQSVICICVYVHYVLYINTAGPGSSDDDYITGAITGGIIGVTVLLIVISALIAIMVVRRRNNHNQNNSAGKDNNMHFVAIYSHKDLHNLCAYF